MNRLLQSLLFNRRTYNRPHDDWICGRACEGCPCALGPDNAGNCRATGECLPAKRGDRWFCTRSEAQGGPCSAGPLPEGGCGRLLTPCVPQRGYRARRGRWAFLTAAAALAIVVLALAGKSRTAWSIPGPLTAHHATSAQRCADCHLESAEWAVRPSVVAERKLAENQLCLKCHDLGPHSAWPHSREIAPHAVLAGSPQPAQPAALKLAHALVPGHGSGELACATCHQEHHGRDSNLARLSDLQCQSCHVTQFASFTSGHPEFSGFPFTRRTRIQFDHASHLQKHFLAPEHSALAPASCASCHETAVDGGLMLVRNFEQTCANCHARQIEGEGRSGAKGVPFFRLPGVDLAALTEAGESVGEWPAFCEGAPTPFMRWLLEDNPADRAALAVLGKTSLDDLSQATRAQKAAAAQIIWSIKSLFADLITQGQPVLMQRMKDGGNAKTARTGQLSADALLLAQQTWLPHLLEEVADYRKGKKPARPEPPAKAAAPTPPPVLPKTAANDDLLSDPAPTPPAKPAANDDLLADPGTTSAVTKPSDDLLLTEAPAAVAVAPASGPAAPPLGMADPEQRVAAGGWYRQDETYTLLYRPIGHADQFLAAWLDASATGQSPAAREIFTDLSTPKAPGLCTKCHTVDETKNISLVNWHAARPEPNRHEFTHFKHAAHFSIAGDKGCQTCHALVSDSNYAASFGRNRDPAKFHSNFAAIDRQTCATCHTPAIAGNSCLQCHNYHTGEFAPQMRIKADTMAPAMKVLR